MAGQEDARILPDDGRGRPQAGYSCKSAGDGMCSAWR
jgi:hypothetical protein